jgi:hypothetical protein
VVRYLDVFSGYKDRVGLARVETRCRCFVSLAVERFDELLAWVGFIIRHANNFVAQTAGGSGNPSPVMAVG